jgi:hypothetical protein
MEDCEPVNGEVCKSKAPWFTECLQWNGATYRDHVFADTVINPLCTRRGFGEWPSEDFADRERTGGGCPVVLVLGGTHEARVATAVCEYYGFCG